MTLCFPDLNVWLALSDIGHEHHVEASHWLNGLAHDAKLIFSRHTQIGLLRLLVSPSVMGNAALTLGKAWDVYDQWLEDPCVAFYPEPRNVDDAFHRMIVPFASQKAAKAVGDCWLLSSAIEIGATLVTFDQPLYEFSRKQGHVAVIPA